MQDTFVDVVMRLRETVLDVIHLQRSIDSLNMDVPFGLRDQGYNPMFHECGRCHIVQVVNAVLLMAGADKQSHTFIHQGGRVRCPRHELFRIISATASTLLDQSCRTGLSTGEMVAVGSLQQWLQRAGIAGSAMDSLSTWLLVPNLQASTCVCLDTRTHHPAQCQVRLRSSSTSTWTSMKSRTSHSC